MKQQLLSAPETQISEYIKSHIIKWDEPATALQILETLDKSIHTAEVSGFVVKVLELLLNNAIAYESTTYEDIVKLAYWRNR